jgi:AbrB family looped-hinge helix DNA binding protein
MSSKGQVTIPKPLRDRLGLREGSQLDFSEDRGTLVARRVAVEDPVAALYGVLVGTHRSSDELVRELRGDDRP